MTVGIALTSISGKVGNRDSSRDIDRGGSRDISMDCGRDGSRDIAFNSDRNCDSGSKSDTNIFAITKR